MKAELMTALTLIALMAMAQLALAADGDSKANLTFTFLTDPRVSGE